MGLTGTRFLQDPTPLPTPETPPVISAVVHATDEEKLASSVTGQKWTCMTVDLNTDKQDYPQPSDLSTFVNETKFSSPTEGTLPRDRLLQLEERLLREGGWLLGGGWRVLG